MTKETETETVKVIKGKKEKKKKKKETFTWHVSCYEVDAVDVHKCVVVFFFAYFQLGNEKENLSAMHNMYCCNYRKPCHAMAQQQLSCLVSKAQMFVAKKTKKK